MPEGQWCAAHERLKKGQAAHERDTHGQRRKNKDEDSKYLLPALHGVRCAAAGKYFYACTAHCNKGPEVCPHGDLWPMEEIDHELLATIAEQFTSATEELITESRQFV